MEIKSKQFYIFSHKAYVITNTGILWGQGNYRYKLKHHKKHGPYYAITLCGKVENVSAKSLVDYAFNDGYLKTLNGRVLV